MYPTDRLKVRRSKIFWLALCCKLVAHFQGACSMHLLTTWLRYCYSWNSQKVVMLASLLLRCLCVPCCRNWSSLSGDIRLDSVNPKSWHALRDARSLCRGLAAAAGIAVWAHALRLGAERTHTVIPGFIANMHAHKHCDCSNVIQLITFNTKQDCVLI